MKKGAILLVEIAGYADRSSLIQDASALPPAASITWTILARSRRRLLSAKTHWFRFRLWLYGLVLRGAWLLSPRRRWCNGDMRVSGDGGVHGNSGGHDEVRLLS